MGNLDKMSKFFFLDLKGLNFPPKDDTGEGNSCVWRYYRPLVIGGAWRYCTSSHAGQQFAVLLGIVLRLTPVATLMPLSRPIKVQRVEIISL